MALTGFAETKRFLSAVQKPTEVWYNNADMLAYNTSRKEFSVDELG